MYFKKPTADQDYSGGGSYNFADMYYVVRPTMLTGLCLVGHVQIFFLSFFPTV